MRSTGQLPSLPPGHPLDDIITQCQLFDDRLVEDLYAAVGDCAKGQLTLAGHAQFANQKNIQGGVERAGRFVGHGDAAPQQTEHERVDGLYFT